MDWTWFLFSFKGRMNRGRAWLALFVILCWMIFIAALAALASLLFGGPARFSFNVFDIFAVIDPAAYRVLPRLHPGAVAFQAAGTALFVWVYLATSIKRLHDRDKSGWWMLPFFVLPGLDTQFAGRFDNPILVVIAGWVCVLLGIWGFVEMYCLRGDPWPNRFGPNPLPKTQARARARSASIRGMPWRQQGELEIRPHVGSAPASIRGTSPLLK